MTKLLTIAIILACLLNGCPDVVGGADWRKACDSVRADIVERAARKVCITRPILRIDTAIQWPRWEIWRGPPYPRMCYDTIYVDTTRYYAKVDTVLLYPRNIGLEYVILPIPGDKYACYPLDTLFDTTGWLPKVQVWLTDEQYDKLMEMLR